MHELLIATHNPGKLREFAAIFAGLELTLRTLDDLGITDDIEEHGSSFAANATLKAEGYMALSGLPTLADDSGLEVAALGGAPGVYSARYGGVTGPAQLQYLLDQMQAIPWHARLARFVCVIALARPGHATQLVEGTLPGVIEFEPKGSGGFGYDPLFYLLDEHATLAEISAERKNQISHRAAAARAARAVLAQW
ncbi:RdgB/HAM1 family non-canonical purine NTP pyrophosphatase [Candidatus Viridilinea mediisalina]|uniref:dITP/XTP pyrophosphatase n=1 Tax=Candidatus Viridilinea mediisalina TaxID=2024553 RepID=A0A2A6RHE1_9CHLR|nr:RdgB/HAM1 family non-canonical purine NTP pyrophosphatase [Candidatus Viridilinea mediisalina]PDW02363.1 non-canonical purine NTP pyrophosphatase, RdgB/HAM1 family [Candidatus Viridilinea mediisalina]